MPIILTQSLIKQLKLLGKNKNLPVVFYQKETASIITNYQLTLTTLYLIIFHENKVRYTLTKYMPDL